MVKNMSNVYITCLHLNHGGVEKAVSSLANMLCEQGFSVTILCSYELCPPAYPLADGVSVVYLTSRKPDREAFWAAVRKLNLVKIIALGAAAIKTLNMKKSTMIRAIKNISDGTIISTRNEHSVIISKYARPGVKKIAQQHCDHAFKKSAIRDFKYKYKNIDYCVLLTDVVRGETMSFMLKGKNTRTKCVTIENFLDTNSAYTNGEKIKQVIAAGRLHPDKAFDRLLDIWQIVSKRIPEWKLKIIGDGPMKKSLIKRAEAYGISDSVIFTGMLSHEEVMREMARSSIYAMTSVSESFGIVLIEALQNALPVIAYDIRVGPREIIEDGGDGYLVKDGDVSAFAEKLAFLMDSEEVRGSFSEHAVKKAEKYTKEKIAEKWFNII